MSGGGSTFFGVVTIPLVRKGAPEKGFNRLTVYTEMILQICIYYSGIPDFRTLKMSSIKLFYKGIENELIEATKPRSK